jgi:hypothetical protein
LATARKDGDEEADLGMQLIALQNKIVELESELKLATVRKDRDEEVDSGAGE